MQWPDGLGTPTNRVPHYATDGCDDCWGDGCFCKVCDQIKSDCKCVYDSVEVQKWIAEEYEVEDWREVDPEDARGMFEGKGVGDDTRWQVCTTCGGDE